MKCDLDTMYGRPLAGSLRLVRARMSDGLDTFWLPDKRLWSLFSDVVKQEENSRISSVGRAHDS